MSARKQVEPLRWTASGAAANLEVPFANAGEADYMPSTHEQELPLADFSGSHQARPETQRVEQLPQPGSALSEQCEHWLTQREVLRSEIKRGREFLEETRQELASLRARLEEWQAYERVCGRNPLQEYMQSLAGKERIEQFLPTWLKRREAQLDILNAQIEHSVSTPPKLLAARPAVVY